MRIAWEESKMPIVPLPQFEADAHLKDAADREAYARLGAPKSIVVRFGSMKLVGEFPYDGSVKPGCGTKLVVRTHRGTELGEMLTTTCSNSGCSKSVSRQEMRRYIENSGGRDYPFYTDGRVLRVASPEDLDRQSRIEQGRHERRVTARDAAARAGLEHLKIVEVEELLGGERAIVHVLSEERLEARDLAQVLSRELKQRVEIHAVGARDEARLTADYEKCGQYCCCKNFLKVLKPVSMKSAKVQKATLDPLKISGRCGRLMCCLRYEDQTYDELRKKLPHKKTRVGTPEGDGFVVDSQILTQLVLVELDQPDEMGRPKRVAIAVEDLTPPENSVAPRPVAPPMPGGSAGGGSTRDRGAPGRGGVRRPPPAPRPPTDKAPGSGPGAGGAKQSPEGGARPERRAEPPTQGARPTGGEHIDLDDIPTDDGTMDERPRGGSGSGGSPSGGPGGPGGRGPGGRRRRRRGPPGPGGGRRDGAGPGGGGGGGGGG